MEDNTTAALSVSTGVQGVLKQLDDKLSTLKTIEETAYKCPPSLDGIGNIQSEMKIEALIRAYASVKTREKGYNDAAVDLGIGAFQEFQLNGCNASQWKHDIDLRIKIITHKETFDKLNSYKERMRKFLSEEDQKSMLLTEMNEFLSK